MARSPFPLFIPQRIAVHHSASSRSTTFAQVRRWHLGRGWAEIGYNHVIDGRGLGTPGRTVPQRAAAVARRNTGTLSVLVVGHNSLTIPKGKPMARVPHEARRWTQRQVDALLIYLDACFVVWPHLRDQVFGHRDVGAPEHPSECPGLYIGALIALDWQIERYWHEHQRR